MTREEKLAILIYDSVWTEEAESVFVEKVKSAIKNFLDNENPWHKASEELPPIDTEIICKMKGVQHTEHFICKWDGEFWWHWGDFGQEVQGWFGLNRGWEVVEWMELPKED